jgi:predicted dienelactone hydrolase
MYKKPFLLTLLLLPLCCLAQQTKIGERTFKFNDTLRHRPLTTEVWYPTTDAREPFDIPSYPFVHINTVREAKLPDAKCPLVLISHGTGGSRMTLEWLADALVAKGYIVAAVDHWGNTYDNKIALNFVTPWERPQDISFVLTQLLQHQELSKVIDEKRIGAAGFSIGGYTVMALAGAELDLDALIKFSGTPQGIKEMTIPEYPNLSASLDEGAVRASFKKSPDLKDSRIKAFFAMSPAAGQGMPDRKSVRRIKSPLFIVGAQSDSICPATTNAGWYHKLISRSKLYIVPGKTGHYVFLNEALGETKKQGGILFHDDATVNRRAVHDKVAAIAVSFFNQSLK